MAAANVIVETYDDLHITPIRKRKRIEFTQSCSDIACEAKAVKTPSCFTNKAFSSTPKKVENKKHVPLAALEGGCNLTPINPYEVVRKPPKKKKRLEKDEQASCFENEGLNLDLPEKKFNPFEVIRTPKPLGDKNCFINAALNLKIQDNSTLANPFEIPRYNNESPNNKKVKDSNEFSFTPCKLQIALPFVPTTQHRIDFQNVSLTQLTPSKLLAQKLVFSPVLKNTFHEKKTLGVIKEESSTDIGKELDCYQLELENSINEAKLRKNFDNVYKMNEIVSSDTAEAKQEVMDDMKVEKSENTCGKEEHIKSEIYKQDSLINIQKKQNKNLIQDNNNAFIDQAENPLNKSDESLNAIELHDLYGEPIGEETLPGNNISPTPFKRNYRTNNNINEKSTHSNEEQQQHKKLTTILRKSMRKLIPQSKQMKDSKSQICPVKKSASSDIVEQNKDNCDARGSSSIQGATNQTGNGIINTIRQSLRRYKKSSRTQASSGASSLTSQCSSNEIPLQSSMEFSIIDKSERLMKLKTNLSKTEYIKIEELTNERKSSLRSSFRHSTHLMKTVFHKKHEEYEFHK